MRDDDRDFRGMTDPYRRGDWQGRRGYGYGYGYGQERRYDVRGRYERDEPGLWERFKNEVREGWQSLTGDDTRRIGREHAGRGYGDQGYGMRGNGPSGYGRDDRDERGMWDRAKNEIREGWDRTRETFSGKGPKGYTRSDDRIREDVCDRLMDHPGIDASEIEVSVKQGEVTLAGLVDRRHVKRLAEEIVEDVTGVKEVFNRLRVDRDEQRSWNGPGTGSTMSTASGTITNDIGR